MAKKLLVLVALTIVAGILFLTIGVRPGQLDFALQLRLPKVVAITLAGLSIGAATIVFQTIVHNNIVTPNLLGMDSLYVLIHTDLVFVLGATNPLVLNRPLLFAIDLIAMSALGLLIYGYLFWKMRANILYILLTGTVLSSFFGAFTDTMQRLIDPNEFQSLQTTLVASFSRVNGSLIPYGAIVLLGILIWTYPQLKTLDVLALGRDKAINLGLDYDRIIRKLLVAVTLTIATATALVGPLTFLGLLIANLARQIFKTHQHGILLPASSLLGIMSLLFGQLLIEQVFNFGVTIGTLINIIGGTYFLYLIITTTRGTSA
jgi:iron complex transport system permease protein